MAEAADDLLDGLACSGCGLFFSDAIAGHPPPGRPRTCERCSAPCAPVCWPRRHRNPERRGRGGRRQERAHG